VHEQGFAWPGQINFGLKPEQDDKSTIVHDESKSGHEAIEFSTERSLTVFGKTATLTKSRADVFVIQSAAKDLQSSKAA
jgi:hypothetical protein